MDLQAFTVIVLVILVLYFVKSLINTISLFICITRC